MKTVRFERSFTYETVYRCETPGDQSGLYVPVAVAERLLGMCKVAVIAISTDPGLALNSAWRDLRDDIGQAIRDAESPPPVPEDNNPCHS